MLGLRLSFEVSPSLGKGDALAPWSVQRGTSGGNGGGRRGRRPCLRGRSWHAEHEGRAAVGGGGG